MNVVCRTAALLAALVAVTSAGALAATPAPHAMPSVVLPKIPLHTEAVVEVNKKGQVVRIKSTKPCKVNAFNVQTFGNALQMWIRRPDGTAEVGLYRVTYDYNPKNGGKIDRRVAIVSSGGSWANSPGAANVMMDAARKQAVEEQKAAAAAAKKRQEQNAKLPSLNQIRGAPASPSPASATLPPV